MTAKLKRTLLKNISDFESELRDGYSDSEYLELLLCEQQGRLVTVDCEATDGYYDITLDNGLELPAISGFHLEGYSG